MDGFASISPETAKQIERLRLLYNRLFVPTFHDMPTMREAPDGGPMVAPTIQLHPTQQGSAMPQITPEQMFMRRMRSYGADKGGPA